MQSYQFPSNLYTIYEHPKIRRKFTITDIEKPPPKKKRQFTIISV